MAKQGTETSPTPVEDPAVARKRRIGLRALQRTTVSDGDSSDEADKAVPKRRRTSRTKSTASLVDDSGDETAMVPSIRGIKKQSRYVPGVPMAKSDLSAWRKEARRVRNRESAAASRKKTRMRVDTLEGEVNVLQSKYAEALKMIVELERDGNSSENFVPDRLRQDLVAVRKQCGAPASPVNKATVVSPPLSPQTSFVLTSTAATAHNQPSMDMISRPTAV